MHHALAISDILGLLFTFTDRSTTATCARVCKAWQENALDILWNRVDGLDRLLRLFGPLTRRQIHSQLMNDRDRWERFTFYANRVRRLEVTDYPRKIPIGLRHVPRLLPNLTHLAWRVPSHPVSSLDLCLLFLTPMLKSLSVETSKGGLFAFNRFFKEVVQNSPRIENLEFRSEMLFRDIGPSLSNFFLGLRCLKAVLLSDQLLTSDIMTALAKCPLLECIHLHSKPRAKRTDITDFGMPVIEPGAFPQLREMGITAHLGSVVSLLQYKFPAGCLRRLEVRTLIMEDNDTIAAFFAQVGEACPGLEVLAVTVQIGSFNVDYQSLPFASLRPLLSCTSLTAFTLRMHAPIDIDDTEASLIASSWPRLRDLSLNPFPSDPFPDVQRSTGKHLTLRALMGFAQYCPELRSLGLYILPSFIPPPAGRKVIPNLNSLRLGLIGTGYTVEDLALFLADITPMKCLVTGSSYSNDEEEEEVSNVKLSKVVNLVQPLRNIHAEYQARLRTLEAQVQRLESLLAASTVEA